MSLECGVKRQSWPGEASTEVTFLTPPGVGAIAVIRVSGSSAKELVEPFLRRRARTTGGELVPDRIVRADFIEGEEPLDDVLLVASGSAGSVSSIDICAHGGVRVVERIISALTKVGAVFRAGEPGISPWPAANLIEQDVWAALTRAKTRQAVRWLLKARTSLPAELRRIAQLACHDHDAAASALQRLADAEPGCRRLIEGAVVALVGPPNAGKSTLANRLLGEERALVSPKAGTTLDWLAQSATIEGVPVTLVDTPGYGPRLGLLDQAAIERACGVIERADARLLVFDGSTPPPSDVRLDSLSQSAGRSAAEAVLVLNKSDLGIVWTSAQLAQWTPSGCIAVSALTGANIEHLKSGLIELLAVAGPVAGQIGLFSARQLQVVAAAEGDPSRFGAAIWALLGNGAHEESG